MDGYLYRSIPVKLDFIFIITLSSTFIKISLASNLILNSSAESMYRL
ncbi:hypothetical protein SC08_Contig83orf02713 [Clostridium butyricum]|nr:hypothetical protein SC08_Contig83orf02713 [Clostridium butyricum]